MTEIFDVEFEIQRLLLEGHPMTYISEWLFEKFSFESTSWNEINLASFYNFLLKTGRSDLLINFWNKGQHHENFYIHRGFLLITLAKGYPEFDEILKAIFMKSLTDNNAEQNIMESLRTKVSRKYFPEIIQNNKTLDEYSRLNYTKIKNDLIQKYNLFLSQDLAEHSKKIIKSLEKIFPEDEEIKKLVKKHKEATVMDVLDKYKKRSAKFITKPSIDPEVNRVKLNFEMNLIQDSKKYSDQIDDLKILCVFIEAFDTAQKLTEMYNASNYGWLELEILFLNRRYLEILNLLPHIEKKGANDADTFFATTYLRALCFWNIGETHSAILVLESLLELNPNYRNGQILLQEWKLQ